MPLNNNEDYYMGHNGLLVFTEKYLLKRGYCCGNRCRHCPYPLKKENVNKPADLNAGDAAKKKGQ